MARPLRMGVVGVGSIGIRGALDHLTLPDVSDRVVVTALCSRSRERLERVGARYSISALYDDYARFLGEAETDAVTLCTPIGLHYEQGLQAIQAGKHVHFNKT